MKWATILRRAVAFGVDAKKVDVRQVGVLLERYPQIAPKLAGHDIRADLDARGNWQVERRWP
jgi:hypothetical protein